MNKRIVIRDGDEENIINQMKMPSFIVSRRSSLPQILSLPNTLSFSLYHTHTLSLSPSRFRSLPFFISISYQHSLLHKISSPPSLSFYSLPFPSILSLSPLVTTAYETLTGLQGTSHPLILNNQAISSRDVLTSTCA